MKLPCFSNLLDPTSPTDEQRSTSDKSDNKRKEITKTWKKVRKHGKEKNEKVKQFGYKQLESMPDRLVGQIITLNSFYLLLSYDLIVHKKNQTNLMLVDIRD